MIIYERRNRTSVTERLSQKVLQSRRV